jgi:ribonuclease D
MPAVTARTLAQAGLSSLCNALLGKPLDKSQQLSDCERFLRGICCTAAAFLR